ncbi:hypothetical protein O3G_MSEX013209 [Manduca sexta]|uniref:Serpin domain-containing protein n=1 Tax=Manduca sexta TaxID=7130 RepID=A0A922CXW1_MANSE|nr:hypothetical protein O3G_MSEX013209 [Manduca sexta]
MRRGLMHICLSPGIKDARYSMILLVPRDRDGIYTLTRDLPYMSLPQISYLMENEDIKLSLPKFTVDYSEDVVATLKKVLYAEKGNADSNLKNTDMAYFFLPVDVNPLSEMLVTNAMYFKGFWRHAFNRRLTRGACFYNRGKCQNVQMMDLQAKLNYAYIDNLRAHAVELPYQDARYSMILLVPRDRDGIYTLTRDLPYMSLPQISYLMEIEDIKLSLPKFTVDYSEDVVAALKKMRINALFSTEANLSSIFEGSKPYVNGIYHKVYMSVDEEGTVAAAASSAMVVPLINDGVDLRADRPFVFFIRDNLSGVVLFEGKIEEPNEFVEVSANGKPARNTLSWY